VALVSTCFGGIQPVTAFSAAVTGIDLSIDFGNGTILAFSDLQGSDVLNVTMSVAEVEMTWQGDLAFVTSIDGVANQPLGGRWWQYWVNGELGGVAANKYQLLDTDSVVWRLAESAYSDHTNTSLDMGIVVGLLGTLLVGATTIALLYRRRSSGMM
jgi:hypothetical protein